MTIKKIHFGFNLVEVSDEMVHEFKRPPLKRKKKNRRWVKKWKKKPKNRIVFVFKPRIENDGIIVSEDEGVIYGSVRALQQLKSELPKIEKTAVCL